MLVKYPAHSLSHHRDSRQDTVFVDFTEKSVQRHKSLSLSHYINLGDSHVRPKGKLMLASYCSKPIPHLSSCTGYRQPGELETGIFNFYCIYAYYPILPLSIFLCPSLKNQVSRVSWPMSYVHIQPYIHAVTMRHNPL